MHTGKLSVRQKAGFGICDLGGNLFFTAMGFWSLNYLTDTALLSAAAAGLAVMVGKIWDAVTDPMMGYLSDRTRSRLGRRRPYMLFGAIPLALAMWFFFTAPTGLSEGSLFAWATLAVCFLNTAYTVVNIPYSSLTPELTKDYHERTSLNGYRFAFAIFGTILGAAIVLPIVTAFPARRAGYSIAGLVMGATMAVTALITFFSVREPKQTADDLPKEGFFASYLSVFKNRAYLILAGSYALNILAINFLQGILVYYCKYVYRNEGLTMPAMVALLVVAMAFIPVSVAVAKKIGKRLTYQLGLGTLGVVCLAMFALGQALGPAFFFGAMGFGGAGLGFTFVAPWAMVPDVAEYDAITTGERKEGAYYGMWTFVSKLGQALSLGLTGLILAIAGYVADAEQVPAVLVAIRFLLGPIPAVAFAGAVALLSRYPLTEKAYAELVKTARDR